MTAGQQRKAQRALHLAAGLMLVAYVYAPVGQHLHDAVRLIVVPVLALTGLAMWQAARIRRLRKSLRGRRAQIHHAVPAAAAAGGKERSS